MARTARSTAIWIFPPTRLGFIILKAREFDVKEGDSDPDEGSNPTDDGNADVLEDKADDPVREELAGRDSRPERGRAGRTGGAGLAGPRHL